MTRIARRTTRRRDRFSPTGTHPGEDRKRLLVGIHGLAWLEEAYIRLGGRSTSTPHVGQGLVMIQVPCENRGTMSATTPEIELATLWFLAARAMTAADGTLGTARQAAAGLYAQAILGITEEDCEEAKAEEIISSLTLLDCLGLLSKAPREVGEKIMTGVMMIAYANRSMHPLEVRWASMLASSMKMDSDDFQRCCVNARVMAGMLGTHAAGEIVDESDSESDEAGEES